MATLSAAIGKPVRRPLIAGGLALLVVIACVVFLRLPVHQPRDKPDSAQRVASPHSHLGEPNTAKEAVNVESAEARLRTGTGPATEPRGTLLILDRATLAAPDYRSPWTFERRNARAQQRESLMIPETGRLALAPGRWRVMCDDSDWRVTPDEFDIYDGQETVIWCVRVAPLTVDVRGPGDNPVPEARVRWAAFMAPRMSHLWQQLAWHGRFRTNQLGRALLSQAPSCGIWIGVKAAGFFGRILPVSSPIPAGIVVVELESSGPCSRIRLAVRDARTGTLLEDPVVSTRIGIADDVRRESDGVYTMSRHFLSGGAELVEIGARGYCPAKVPVDRDTQEIEARLLRAAMLELVNGTPDAQDAKAWIRIVADMGSTPRPHLPPSVVVRAARPTRLAVPRGVALEIHAIVRDGRHAVGYLTPTGPRERLTLKFTRADALRIEVSDESGAAVDVGVVTAFFNNGPRLKIKAAQTGVVYVPACSQATSVRLDPPRHSQVKLYPSPLRDEARNMSRRNAVVRLRLARTFESTIRVTSEGGIPCSGMRLRVVGEGASAAYSTYPKLQGHWPTNNSGWVYSRRGTRLLTLDASGTAATRLSAGHYAIGLDVPRSIRGDQGGSSGYPSWIKHRIVVSGPGEHVLIASRAVPFVVEARDADTGKPLRHVLIQTDVTGAGMQRERDGFRQELWLPNTVKRLRVTSSGYQSKWVRIKWGGTRYVRVALGRSRVQHTLVLESNKALPRRLAVRLLAWDKPRGMQRTKVWQRDVILDDATRPLPVDMPGGGPWYVTLVFGSDHRAWRVEPMEVIATLGATLRFHVRQP